MIRQYGRATSGPQGVAPGPDHYGTKQTRSAALRLDGLEAPWVVDGAIKGERLHGWVREVLCPPLPPGAIVRWDTLAAHTVAGGEALLATRGARLLRGAPAAPDGTPMEQW